MLELKNISLNVEDGKEILKNINLKLEDNRFVVLTGPNGGGKSTLAKVIAGILKPAEGQILLDGKDITGSSITERANLGIGFAFQQPVRFKGITVRDLITLAAVDSLDERQVCSYLREVGLCAKDYIDREVNASLSGGEIKRIEIAMLIARKARLSVFDEPEAGIDLWSFSNLIEVFTKMRKENSGSILIISHQERILDIADEIVVLAGGEITAHGSKDQVMPELFQENCRFCTERNGCSRA